MSQALRHIGRRAHLGGPSFTAPSSKSVSSTLSSWSFSSSSFSSSSLSLCSSSSSVFLTRPTSTLASSLLSASSTFSTSPSSSSSLSPSLSSSSSSSSYTTSAASATAVVRSPFDGREVGRVPVGSADDAERMLAKAAALHAARSTSDPMPTRLRTSILESLASLMSKHSAELVQTIVNEGGKPRVDATVEVQRAIDGVHLAREELQTLVGRQIPLGKTAASAHRLAWTVREPIGPVVAVSAFNHPLNLIVHQVVPAVATGCPVIVKPALATPLSCLRLVELLREAGLPEGWCQAIVCDNAVAEALVTDRRVAFFSFIGSARVGWRLRAKLAPGTRCALEHGGLAPVIVVDDDIPDLVPLLTKGGFYHAGQVCVSVQRVYVPHRGAEALASRLGEAAAKLTVGDPNDVHTDVGPLITAAEADRVEAWVREAVDGGARLVTGGKRLGPTLYSPTVLLNPPEGARISREEVFGPVVCVYGVSSPEEAVVRANALPFAFQASVFARSWETALQVGRRIDASAVLINDHTAFRVDWMPFAGRRESGHAVGGIGPTMHDMTQEKMFVFRSPSALP